MSIENPESEEIIEINGRKYRKEYVGDGVGWDDKPLTEKRFFSHEGPGWDGHLRYLEERGVKTLTELSDEPYIYHLIPDEEEIKRREAELEERKKNAKLFRIMRENAEKFPDFNELRAYALDLLKKESEKGE